MRILYALAAYPQGSESYIEAEMNYALSWGVTVISTLSRAWATAMIRTSGIYLDTSDPTGHPFGMPISIAEAMASGCYVLARNSPAVHEYVGSCGAVYDTTEEAADHIERALKWQDDTWESVSASARGRAADFRSDVVLPKLVENWIRFTG